MQIEKLKEILDTSKNIVVLSGAGVSTASGIKDFRGENGLNKMKLPYTPEEMLSIKMLEHQPLKFFEFYRTYMNSMKATSNIIHKYLKKLEDNGKLLGIITQNIDGLHKQAGNKKVYEIHGSIYDNYCVSCNETYDASYVMKSTGIPKCKKCGGVVRPNIVLYGEPMNDCFTTSYKLIKQADLLLVLGTSLVVYPANSLVDLFTGKYLVILNLEPTPYDNQANLVIHEDLKTIFEQLN